jgi:hypothetical protein
MMDAHHLANGNVGHPLIEQAADVLDLIFGKFHRRVFCPAMGFAALEFVAFVVAFGSGVQVGGVAARRIVAVVAN